MSVGFLVVDKPAGITSHDVVSVLRRVFGIKKIGHTGTLDPFATGVLPMAIGHATRLIQYLDEGVKVYEARIQFGISTDTGDLHGSEVATAPVPSLDEEQVASVLSGFLGDQMQTPPAYSAVKVNGRALYKYAREGKAVQASARPIRIDALSVLGMSGATLDIRVVCGRGTYVRVLAEQIAEALGTCGHLVALRRHRSGPFLLDDAIDFASLSELVSGRTEWPAVLRPRRGEPRLPWREPAEILAVLNPRLLTPASVLSHLPVQSLDATALRLLQLRGQVEAFPEGIEEGGCWCVYDQDRLLGIMRRDGDIGRVARILPTS
jgi:tRNA pseudouridine55 synthase